MPEQKSVQIKICGITGKEEIRWLNEEDVSYAGFVLYEKSSRYVPIRKVSELFEELNENIKRRMRHVIVLSVTQDGRIRIVSGQNSLRETLRLYPYPKENKANNKQKQFSHGIQIYNFQ